VTGFGGSGINLEATSSDDFYLFAIGGSGAETFAGAGSVVLNTMHSDTQAFIGAGAKVNADNTGADPNQSVRLRADHGTQITDGAGSIADADTVALGLQRTFRILPRA